MAAWRGSFGVARVGIPLGLCFGLALSCAPPQVQGAKAPDDRASVRKKQSTPSVIEAPPALQLELTVDEEQRSARVSNITSQLRALGERNANHPWELADAAELMGHELSEMGAAPRRLTVEHEGVAYHSFSVDLGGAGAPFEVLAFYDSGAIGPAVALELARIFVPARLEHPLRLVLCAHPSSELLPIDGFSASGSGTLGRLVLGEGLGAAEVQLSWLSPGGGSESSPAEAWPNLLVSALRESPLSPARARGPTAGPHSPPFTLLLNGNGNLVENFDLAAVRVSKIRAFLADLLGEKPTNDQILTPL